MSEETEGQNLSQENRQLIEVEAPERLALGQNLYDQEPFSTLAQSLSESSKKTRDKVHAAISYFAKKHFDLSQDNPNPTLTQLLNDIYLPPVAREISGPVRLGILEALKQYPYSSEYIVQQQQNKAFDSKGRYVATRAGKHYKPPFSYANWVTKKLQRQKNLWLVGIEEIFPKDVGYPVTSHPNVTGIKPVNRRYRILKAAEIIK